MGNGIVDAHHRVHLVVNELSVGALGGVQLSTEANRRLPGHDLCLCQRQIRGDDRSLGAVRGKTQHSTLQTLSVRENYSSIGSGCPYRW